MFSRQNTRMIGSGFDKDAVPDINKFRTKEVLDEDNIYNRQALELSKKKVLSMSAQPDVSKPLTTMTDQEKYLLNMHINRFINEIDNELGAFYNNVLHYNTGKLINYWNILTIYYKTNVAKTYKTYLDSQIQGEPVEKVRIIRELAFDSDYIDKNEIAQLYNNMVNSNYEPIRHILYSENDKKEYIDKVDEPIIETDYEKYIPYEWSNDVSQLLIDDLKQQGYDDVDIADEITPDKIKQLIDNTNKNQAYVKDIADKLGAIAPDNVDKTKGKKQVGRKRLIKSYQPAQPKILTPYEQTQLPQSDPRHRQVIRSRNIPLGAPLKYPQTQAISVNPQSIRKSKLRPKRKPTEKQPENDPEDEEQETEEETPKSRVGRPRTKLIPDPNTPKNPVGRPRKASVASPAPAPVKPIKPIKLKTQLKP